MSKFLSLRCIKLIDTSLKYQWSFYTQEEEIEKLSRLHEDLEKKNEECESLKKHLTKAMYQGKSFALMPSIDDDHEVSSPFLTPKLKAETKPKHKPKVIRQKNIVYVLPFTLVKKIG